jgi:PhnB protein
MATKRRSRSSARKSAPESARKSTRKPARKAATRSTRKRGKEMTTKRGRSAASGARARERGRDVATRVTRAARKVLFGTLGVAGYVGDAARRRGRSVDGAGGGVKPIPEGYRTVTPYLVVRGVPRLIEFLEQAFGATEVMRHPRPDGTVMHAEVQIGDSRVMMGEPPPSSPPMPASIHLYAVDTDALYHLALQAGATSLREPADQFYGERTAGVQDPVGNQWWIATRVENLSPEEIALRAALTPSGP